MAAAPEATGSAHSASSVVPRHARRLSQAARSDRDVPRLLVRPAARFVGLDARDLDDRGRRQSQNHRPVRAGRHALHDQVPVGAADRRAQRAVLVAPSRPAARLAAAAANPADRGDRLCRRVRSRCFAFRCRARRADGRDRFGDAGHHRRCVPCREPRRERAGRRHGGLCRRLSDRRAGFDRGRAVSGELVSRRSASITMAPGAPAISPWLHWC